MGAGLHMHSSQLCEFQPRPPAKPCCLLLPLATLGLGFHTLTNTTILLISLPWEEGRRSEMSEKNGK